MKDGCTFRFSNYRIIEWSNSSVDCCFDIYDFQHHYPNIFYQKINKPLSQVHIHHMDSADQVSADLVKFIEEILNGKLHFCAVYL